MHPLKTFSRPTVIRLLPHKLHRRGAHINPLGAGGIIIIIIIYARVNRSPPREAYKIIINPRRECAERVTVVVSCVCMYVCPHTLFWQYAQLEV